MNKPAENYEIEYNIIVKELKEFMKSAGFSKAIIGMSGGIDSALVTCLAVDALGSENVLGVTMPSQYSSEGSWKDAAKQAKNLGIKFNNIPIGKIYKSYQKNLPEVFPGRKEVTLAEENLQARIRANILMGFSNAQNALVINTCNLTEDLLGYATMYGDAIGAIAPLGKIGKLGVYKLAGYKADVIPKSCFTKPPSAELKPDQTDEDSLPAPYEVLDPLTKEIYKFRAFGFREAPIVKELGPKYGEDIVKKVRNLIVTNMYKEQQAPPVLSCKGINL